MVVALWILITLSILSVALGNFVLSQLSFAKFYRRSTLSLHLARAACFEALNQRRSGSAPGFDTERELNTRRHRAFKGGIGYAYYFEDEQAKININTASKEVLENLPGVDEDLADEIVNSLRRPFKVEEELMLVDGMTEERFKKLQNSITVYGDGKININTAHFEVLSAFGLDPDLISVIMRYRQESAGPDEQKGTDDDGAFLTAGSVLGKLNEFDGSLFTRQQQNLLALQGSLITKSNYLKIKITPTAKGGPGDGFSAVADIKENRILFWAE